MKKPRQPAAPKPPVKQPNRNATGLPDRLKAGVESLSGHSLDEVRVHYNSARPAQLEALAYAQGPDIHVVPGPGQHLPHEAWHVMQQQQGRVRPTAQLAGRRVNDDAALEREADDMGEKAALMPTGTASAPDAAQPQNRLNFTARSKTLDAAGPGWRLYAFYPDEQRFRRFR